MTFDEVQRTRALEFFTKHRDHVERLMKEGKHVYPPSGSDRLHPELWKSAMWRWFFHEKCIKPPLTGPW
jgi:hypothetical protein